MPGLQARPPVRGVQETTNQWFSHTSRFLFLPLKINKILKKKKKKKRQGVCLLTLELTSSHISCIRAQVSNIQRKEPYTTAKSNQPQMWTQQHTTIGWRSGRSAWPGSLNSNRRLKQKQKQNERSSWPNNGPYSRQPGREEQQTHFSMTTNYVQMQKPWGSSQKTTHPDTLLPLQLPLL